MNVEGKMKRGVSMSFITCEGYEREASKEEQFFALGVEIDGQVLVEDMDGVCGYLVDK